MKKIYLLLILLSLLPSFGGAGVVAQTVDKILCSGTSFTINSTAYPSTASTYQWLENGQVVSGATDADYTIPATQTGGVYTYIRQSKSATCVDWQNSNAYTVQVVDHVTIAGNNWAISNVDTYQTFAANAHDYGMFYQWNDSTAFSATDPLSPAWTTTPITDASWTVNPCPSGWRLPTQAEYQNLNDAGSYWTANYNGVAGRWYGMSSGCTLSTCIFLPAVGHRSNSGGALYGQGSYGYYWSSTEYTSHHGYGLGFHSGISSPSYNNNKVHGFSVRCVK